MLTETQKKFVALEKKKAEVKKFYEELDAALADVIEEIGMDKYFQDPEDGTVYKTVKPAGTFVAFKDVDYSRTRRGHLGEKAGLSMKEVEDAGFVLTVNQKSVKKD